MQPQRSKTLSQFLGELERAGKQIWYDARNAYHKGSRKLSDLVGSATRGAGELGRGVQRGVQRSQEGYDFIHENAPEARENIEKLSRDLKKK